MSSTYLIVNGFRTRSRTGRMSGPSALTRRSQLDHVEDDEWWRQRRRFSDSR